MNRFLSVGLLRSAVFASVALSLIACFLFYQSRDEQIPFGSRSLLSISGIDDRLTKAEAAEIVVGTAQKFQINLAKVTVDPEAADPARLLVVFVGNRTTLQENWPGSTYPSFSRSIDTRIVFSPDLGSLDIRGAYVSDATETRADAAARALTAAGVWTQVENISTAQVLTALVGSPLIKALFGMLAALVVVIAYSIAHRQKVYALKRLHGQSQAKIALSELGSLASIFVGSAVVLAIPGLLFLWLYNDLRQAGPFLWLCAQVLGVHAAVLAVILLFAFVTSRTDDIVNVVKGRRPLANLAIFSVIAQSVSLVLIFLLAAATVQLLTDTRSNRDFAARWQPARDFVTVNFTARTEDEFQSAMPRFGELVRESDEVGTMILAYQPPPAPPGFSAQIGPLDGNSLLVNPRFLEEQKIFSKDGERILTLDQPTAQILLLVPEQLEPQVATIENTYIEWAKFERTIQGADPDVKISLTTVFTRSGQKIFNYGGTFARPQIAQADPVVAVVSADSGVMSDSFLISAATTGNILFTDPAELADRVAEIHLGQDIASVDRASEQALTYLAERDGQLRASTLVAAFTLLVLLFSNAILASVYCDRFRQVSFQKFVHGFPFIRRHALFVSLSLAWSALLIGVSASVNAISFDVVLPVSAVVVLANLGCAVMFALMFERRFRGDSVKRY